MKNFHKWLTSLGYQKVDKNSKTWCKGRLTRYRKLHDEIVVDVILKQGFYVCDYVLRLPCSTYLAGRCMTLDYCYKIECLVEELEALKRTSKMIGEGTYDPFSK